VPGRLRHLPGNPGARRAHRRQSGKPAGYHPNIRGRSRFVPDDRSLSLFPTAQPRLSWVITGGDESRGQIFPSPQPSPQRGEGENNSYGKHCLFPLPSRERVRVRVGSDCDFQNCCVFKARHGSGLNRLRFLSDWPGSGRRERPEAESVGNASQPTQDWEIKRRFTACGDLFGRESGVSGE
jgi:hypothetical protein